MIQYFILYHGKASCSVVWFICRRKKTIPDFRSVALAVFFSRKINSIFCKVYFSWWCSVCCCKSCLFNLAIPPKTWLVRRPRKHFTQKLQNWSFQRLEFQKSFEQFQHQFGKRCSNYLKYNGFPRDQVSQRIKVGWYAVSFSTVELNSKVGPDNICRYLSEFGPNLVNA